MDEKKRNLCAMIPAELHERVRAEQEALGLTLGAYMEAILKAHFDGKEEKGMDKSRTLAFQVSDKLFARLKEYLAQHKISQREFVVGLIEKALDEAESAE